MSTRHTNENRFTEWEELKEGGRRYKRKVMGRNGWYAVYVKVTDSAEVTIAFWQEIYNEKGQMTEIHHKFPTDTGHQIIQTS